MALKVTKVQVWAGKIEDKPGGLAAILEPLADAGVNLECVIARRMHVGVGPAPEGGAPADEGVVFITPVKGKRVQNAATGAGLKLADNIATLRVEGNNKAGVGAKMTRGMAEAGINVRGVSAAVLGNKFVAYIGLDSADDATKAMRVLKRI